MNYPWIDDYCLAKVGAEMDYKLEWEAHRFMLYGKMFAMKGEDDQKRPILTIKLAPANGEAMRQAYADIIPGYYMNKTHWNSVLLNGSVPHDVFQSLIDESYALILASLPKKTQKEILGE